MQLVKNKTAGHDPERQRLLAKVHIAKKDLRMPDEDYRAILKREFGKGSAAQLNDLQLRYLVEYFKSKGWQPRPPADPRLVTQAQLTALRRRAGELADEIPNGARRLRGLVWAKCGVEHIEWCRSAKDLTKVLAILENIKNSEADKL